MTRKHIFLLFFFGGFFLAQSQNNDSLEAELKKEIQDSVKLKILDMLSWNYLGIDLAKAGTYALRELEFAKRINNKQFIAQGENDYGIVLINQGKCKEALAYHMRALEIRLTLNSQSDIASSWYKLAYCYTETDQNTKAYSAALKALTIYEKLGNKQYISKTLDVLCDICILLYQPDNVLKYSKQAMELAIESGDKSTQAASLNYVAEAYFQEKKINEGMLALNKSLALFIELGDSLHIAGLYNNLGYYYRKKKDDKEGLRYFLLALDIAKKIEDHSSEVIYSKNIGNVYLDIGKYEEAEKYLKRAENLAKEQQMPAELELVYKAMGDLYAKSGQGDKATEYYNRFILLKDSVFSEEAVKQVTEMQVKYETEKKEKLLETEKENSRRQKKIYLLSFIGIFLLTALVLYIFNQRKNLKQKAVSHKQKLEALIEGEEKERGRIARDLHDGIVQDLTAIKLKIDKTTNNHPEFKDLVSDVDRAAKEVRDIAYQMMPVALREYGLIAALEDLLQKSLSPNTIKYEFEAVQIEERLPEKIEVCLYRITQELINNVLKHSQASLISVLVSKHNNFVTLIFEDNGKGFRENEIKKGIGMNSLGSRLEMVNGSLKFESKEGAGTTAIIKIPLTR